MKLISEADVQDLQWTRVKRWKSAFELHSGDEVLARLYPQRGTHSMVGEAADGRWAFRRRGFWNADIVVTDLASQAEIAVLKQGRNKSLVFSDGRLFTLQKTSFWRNEWVWLNDEGTRLLYFQHGKHLMLEPLALSLPELSLLVIGGRHLIVLQQEEDAASAAATVAWIS
jgi:hypothetical protein